MLRFREKIKALQKTIAMLPGQLKTESFECIENNADTLADYNREQLFQGERTDGTPIEPVYRPLTRIIKQQKGQPIDRVTVKDTGAFYRGINVQVQNDTAIFDSRNSKTNKLERKYSTNNGFLIGISNANLVRFRRDILKPHLLKTLQLTFFNV